MVVKGGEMGGLQREESELKERSVSSEAVVVIYDGVVVKNEGGIGCICTEFSRLSSPSSIRMRLFVLYLVASFLPHGNFPTHTISE